MLANYPIEPRRIKSKRSLDEKSVAVPATESAMVCKLAQISPEI
jgi:hypothetical protein